MKKGQKKVKKFELSIDKMEIMLYNEKKKNVPLNWSCEADKAIL